MNADARQAWGPLGAESHLSRHAVAGGLSVLSRAPDLMTSKLPSDLIMRSLYSRPAMPFLNILSSWTIPPTLVLHVCCVCVRTAGPEGSLLSQGSPCSVSTLPRHHDMCFLCLISEPLTTTPQGGHRAHLSEGKLRFREGKSMSETCG